MPERTRLADFMDRRDLPPRLIAAKANISRRYIYYLRNGTCDPTLSVMLRVARACSESLQRRVRVVDLFDLGDG
jgi:predicted transcriptional regulator